MKLFQTISIGHLTWNLPEFFHWRLFFLSSGQMTRIIDWEKHNVPVCWKPSHEKWTVEVLVSNFYNLCGSNPRWWHWQDDQKSPDSLQNHGHAGQAASLDSVFLAAVLRMSLCSIIPCKQERNTNVWKSSYKTEMKETDSRITSVLFSLLWSEETTNTGSFSVWNLCSVRYIVYLGPLSRPWWCWWSWWCSLFSEEPYPPPCESISASKALALATWSALSNQTWTDGVLTICGMVCHLSVEPLRGSTRPYYLSSSSFLPREWKISNRSCAFGLCGRMSRT